MGQRRWPSVALMLVVTACGPAARGTPEPGAGELPTHDHVSSAAPSIEVAHAVARCEPGSGPGISPVAGGAPKRATTNGGLATDTRLLWPSDVAVDAAGNLFILETNRYASGHEPDRLARVLRVAPGGTIEVLIGPPISRPPAVGPAVRIAYPSGLAVDVAGSIYVSGAEGVWRIDSDGQVEQVLTTDRVELPMGLAVDSERSLYVPDFMQHTVWRVDPDGTVIRFAGNGQAGHTGDGGPAVLASLNNPTDIAVDGEGRVYISDIDGGYLNSARIRRVDTTGIIQTVAGGGERDLLAVEGGVALDAAFNAGSIAVDGAGNLFAMDEFAGRIFRVAPDGLTTTAAFPPLGPYDDSQDDLIELPTGLAIDDNGALYFADFGPGGRVWQLCL